MSRSPLTGRWARRLPSLLAAGLLALTAARPAAGQEPPEDWRFGFQGLQLLCKQSGLQPVTDLTTFRRLPEEQTVLIVVGDLAAARQTLGLPTPYLRRGGALLVASDLGDGGYLSVLNTELQPAPLTVPPGATAYLGLTDCPLVTRFHNNHPLCEGIVRLATNRPGAIRRTDFEAVAWLPPDLRANGRPVGERALVVAAEFLSGGRLIVAADHSLFINEMLLHGDNARFAGRCAAWLARGGRRHLLIIEDGQPLGAVRWPLDPSAFDVPAKLPDRVPDIPPESMLAFANSFIAGLEDADVFNQVLTDQPRGVRPDDFRRAVILLATLFLLLFAGFWLLLTRARARLPAAPAAAAPTPLLVRRHQTVVRQGEFGETAQTLAREFFERFWRDARRRAGSPWDATAPGVSADGSWWERLRLRRAVRRLWAVAAGPVTGGWTARRLRALLHELEGLDDLRAEGRLRLTWPA